MKNPRFSICIPNYNYEKYLGITIESVLKQDFDDYEIVIVDNASTDSSWNIIQDFAAKDSRFRIYRNKVNIGFAPNLQEVTRLAKGEFILLLSSDDLMRKGALKKIDEVIKELGDRAKRAVLHTASSIIDENGKENYSVYRDYNEAKSNINGFFSHVSSTYHDFDGEYFTEKGRVVLSAALGTGKSAATFCTTFFPRELWSEVGGYDVSFQIIPDTIFLYRLLHAGSEIVYVHEKLFDYRIHSKNQLSSVSGNGPLKTQLDGYLFLIRYPEIWFDEVGINKREVVFTYLKKYCAREALISLSEGQLIQSIRKLKFGVACYPAKSLVTLEYYLASFLIVLFPITRLIIKAYQVKRNKV